MKLKKIRLRNFRNYEDCSVNFHDNINVFYGNNAQGKSNLVEAIYYASLLNSFRTTNHQSLIKKNQLFSIMEYEFENNKKTLKIKIVLNKNGKKIFVDEVEFKKFREYIGNINIVSFSNDDLRLFKESPKERRKFIDIEISKFDKEYLMNLLKFKKCLKQRNEILKHETNYLREYLAIIDKKIADYSKKIYDARKKMIELVNKDLTKVYQALSESKSEVVIEYQPFINKEDLSSDDIEKYYQETLEKDILKKQTLNGVQKEDFVCYIDENKMEEYASQGQQRLLLLSVKLTILKLIEKENKINALLILDDVFSELDEKKRKELIKYLENSSQAFITTTDRKDFVDLKNMKDQVSYFEVKDGIIKERMEE